MISVSVAKNCSIYFSASLVPQSDPTGADNAFEDLSHLGSCKTGNGFLALPPRG